MSGEDLVSKPSHEVEERQEGIAGGTSQAERSSSSSSSVIDHHRQVQTGTGNTQTGSDRRSTHGRRCPARQQRRACAKRRLRTTHHGNRNHWVQDGGHRKRLVCTSAYFRYRVFSTARQDGRRAARMRKRPEVESVTVRGDVANMNARHLSRMYTVHEQRHKVVDCIQLGLVMERVVWQANQLWTC